MNPSTSSTDLLLVLSVLYGLVILGVVAVILTALFRVKKGHSASVRDVFRQSRFLELTTVLVIIISGTYLAMSGKLTEGVVALLSGIAGYVLGGLSPTRQQQDPNAGTPAKEQQAPSAGDQSSSPVVPSPSPVVPSPSPDVPSSSPVVR